MSGPFCEDDKSWVIMRGLRGLYLIWFPDMVGHWSSFYSGSSLVLSLKFFKRRTNMGQSFDFWMATLSLTWCSVFLMEVDSRSSLFPLLDILLSHYLAGLWNILEPPHLQPFSSWGCLFPFIQLATRASVLLPTNTWPCSPLSLTVSFLTQIPHSSLLWFISSPPQVGSRFLTLAVQLVKLLFSFYKIGYFCLISNIIHIPSVTVIRVLSFPPPVLL